MNKKSFVQKIVDSGSAATSSEAELRCLRVTNVTAFIGFMVMNLWTVVTTIIGAHSSSILSVFGAIFFSLVIILNWKSKRIFASTWLMITAFTIQLANLYLYGYESGVALFALLYIILPYVIFPRNKRWFAHIFGGLALLDWMILVVFKVKFKPAVNMMSFEIQEQLNAGMIGFSIFGFIWAVAIIVDNAEDSLKLEQEKSDKLLQNILPESIATRLKENPKIIADSFDSVSVLFADLVGFTKLSARLTPEELVEHLNEMFSEFDKLTEKYGLEKIKTIGDAYMVSGGLPTPDSNHVKNIALMALDMQKYMEERNKISDEQLSVRVGIHVGPVVAGVIGVKRFAYDLWGDTVNTASRMESHGIAGKVHVSSAVKEILGDEFVFEARGGIDIKGKGTMETWFLLGRK